MLDLTSERAQVVVVMMMVMGGLLDRVNGQFNLMLLRLYCIVSIDRIIEV